jgi:hypothetical protein
VPLIAAEGTPAEAMPEAAPEAEAEETAELVIRQAGVGGEEVESHGEIGVGVVEPWH